MTELSIVERVQRGATLLDERMPGWASRVNKDDLRITCTPCLLSQLYGSFFGGAGALEVWGQSEKWGFNGQQAAFKEDSEEEELVAAWLEEINRRIPNVDPT